MCDQATDGPLSKFDSEALIELASSRRKSTSSSAREERKTGRAAVVSRVMATTAAPRDLEAEAAPLVTKACRIPQAAASFDAERANQAAARSPGRSRVPPHGRVDDPGRSKVKEPERMIAETTAARGLDTKEDCSGRRCRVDLEARSSCARAGTASATCPRAPAPPAARVARRGHSGATRRLRHVQGREWHRQAGQRSGRCPPDDRRRAGQ